MLLNKHMTYTTIPTNVTVRACDADKYKICYQHMLLHNVVLRPRSWCNSQWSDTDVSVETCIVEDATHPFEG